MPSEKELSPSWYRKMRRLARARLRRFPPGQTMQSMELAHEAYMRMDNGWDDQDSARFYRNAWYAVRAAAAERYRYKHAQRRRGGKVHIALSGENGCDIPDDRSGLSHRSLLRLHRALDKLQTMLPQNAELVKLRYFHGMTLKQIAERNGESTSTVERRWRFTRAWLKKQLHESVM